MDPRELEAEQNRIGMHGPTPILERLKRFGAALVGKTPAKELTEEVARPELAGVRAMWDQSVASGLTPERLATLLRQSIRGDIRAYLELAEEMEERDLHYFSVLGTRKRALSRLRPSVEPTTAKRADGKVATAVRALVEEPQFRAMLRDLTDAFGKGYSAVEIIWREDAGMWKPAYVWRDPKYFTFDHISRSELRLAELGTIDGLALDPGKWIVHKPKLKSGIPIRSGFARIAAWAFLFKSFSLKDWASFLDVYGMPIRLGKYHPSATPEERRKLLQAVMQIASDAAAIIPESMLIELLEVKNAGGGTSTPFEQIGRYLDEQLSKAILGQTMTVENGGSLAQAKVHNQIRIDILEDDADQLAVTINEQLIAPFVAWNFGAGAVAPYVVFPVAEPEDIAVLATAIEKLVPLGLKVSADEVRGKLGLSEPDDDDELLAPPAAPIGHNGGPPLDDPETDRAVKAATNAARPALYRCPCGCGKSFAAAAVALNAESAGADEVDAVGAEEAADWEPQMTPIVEAILDAADASSSFEEFKELLAALAGGLDTSALEKRLAIAAMKARGLGSASNGGR